MQQLTSKVNCRPARVFDEYRSRQLACVVRAAVHAGVEWMDYIVADTMTVSTNNLHALGRRPFISANHHNT